MPCLRNQLRRRCQTLLDGLHLPRPFSVGALCSQLAEERGRPLHLHPMPARSAGEGACGLWLATATDDHIFFEQHTAPLHQEHIVLHEIGHLLFDHKAYDTAAAGVALGSLFRTVNPDLIRRMLGRTNYSSRQEQEAEMLASLIRTHRQPTVEQPPVDTLGRLGAALGVDAPHGG